MDGEYISTKEARKILGVTQPTLVSWSKENKIRIFTTPTGRRHYNKQDIYNISNCPKTVSQKRKIAYCRVSSKKQMDDLERQKEFLKSQFPNHYMVTDIGSGINFNRKGLKTILELSMSGKLSEIVVAHRDRLCRFAFELLEEIFRLSNVKLIVLNGDSKQPSNVDEELSDDILSIIHVYSCRKLGRRKYKTKNKNGEDLSNKKTEDLVQ